MVEVIPFLLILISWDPALGPETMEVRTHLYVSATECEDAGRIAESLDSREEAERNEFEWRCVEMPRELENRPELSAE